MGNGKSSRLYQKLVYEDRIAQDVAAQVWPTQDCGISFIVATARPGVEAEELEAALLEVLTGVQRGGLPDAEVKGGVNRALRELVNHLAGIGSRTDAIATSTTFLDQPDYVNQIFERVAAVTAKAAVDIACEWLVPERRATLHVLPHEAGED